MFKKYFLTFISLKIIFFLLIYYYFLYSVTFGDNEQFFVHEQLFTKSLFQNLKIFFYQITIDLENLFSISLEYADIKRVYLVQLITQTVYKYLYNNFLLTNLFFYLVSSIIFFNFILNLKKNTDILIFFILAFSPSFLFYGSFVSKELIFNLFLMISMFIFHSNIHWKFKFIGLIPINLILINLRPEITIFYLLIKVVYYLQAYRYLNYYKIKIIILSFLLFLCLWNLIDIISYADIIISNRYQNVFYNNDASNNIWNLNNHSLLQIIINMSWGIFSNYTTFLIGLSNNKYAIFFILYGYVLIAIQFILIIRMYKIFKFEYFIIILLCILFLNFIIYASSSYNFGYKARLFQNIYILVLIYPLFIINKIKDRNNYI